MTVDEDLDKLLENLPFFIQENLKNHSNKDKLIEIVMDRVSGSTIRGRGSGQLLFNINTNGKFEMFGDFIVY